MAPSALRVFNVRMSSACARNGAIRLGHDLEGASEAVEVIHIGGAHVGLKGVKHIRELHALLLDLVAIHVDIQLRHVDLVGAQQARQLRTLRGFAQRILNGRVQRFGSRITAVLDLSLEAAEGS